MPSLRFRESQKFRQPWVWGLLAVSVGLVLWIFGKGLVQQVVAGRPWGDRPMSDIGLVLTSLVTFAFCLGMAWMFLAMTLSVEVRSDALHIHFKFWRRRTVAYGDIAEVSAVEFRPIVQYGGWGIRRGRGGWAYIVSGKRGVRLDFHDGSHLLIGSQRPTEMAAAIEKERGR